MKNVVLVCLLTLAASAAFAENWLTRLFSSQPEQISFECAVRDHDCLIGSAIDLLILRLQHREDERSWTQIAEEGQRLLSMASSELDRIRLLSKFEAIELPDGFLERLNVPPTQDTSWITEPQVRADFRELHSSVQGNFELYANYAIETLLERDSARAMSIWWDYLEMLQRESPDTVESGFRWLLKNDAEGLVSFINQYTPPDSALFDVHELMAHYAADACRFGEPERGETILEMLDLLIARARPTADLDEGFFVMDYAPSVEASLHCRGEVEAFKRLDDVIALADRAMKAVGERITEERQRAFAISVIRSEVGEGSTIPLAIWLHREGRRQDAEHTLARMPYYGTTTTIQGLTESGILSLEAMSGRLDEVLRHYGDEDSYYENPNVVLDWFARVYDEEYFNRCCVQDELLKRVLDASKKLGPDPKAQAAALRVFEYLERLHQSGSLKLYEWHEIEINFARSERETSGCQVADATLRRWLDAIATYPSLVKRQYFQSAYPGDWHQSKVTEAYLGYLTAAPGEVNGPCLIN
ncbi:hypothetical protein [Tritonibacter scottomollicae]|uniref:DUF4034 domain-containing protein n=1 Tax=Tritonibacter scottomollicae TaxID=483013 RepID=A0A2T1A451_TRISK|nr:hypothetical protein [Tritonibacter scottomollicae]PRZ43314.1 hypothetical protein CLV89_12819 [Tritonibacter scottomollicae]